MCVAKQQTPTPVESTFHPELRNAKFALDPTLLAFARDLRQKHSDAERYLWALLRARRFCGMKFRRQHPVAPYILDFYCDERQLAIELDGGQHNTDAALRHDCRRTEILNARGITVLRFWNHDVFESTDAVLEAIHNALTPTLSRRERE
jgi:very-short-patch-repair endonuclease